MSKKLYSTGRWKKQIRAAQSRELKKKLRTRSKSGFHNHQAFADTIKYRHLTAPDVFSLIQNPEDTIDFLNDIENVSQKKNISLDISGISVLTPDAIAALTATIGRPKFDGRNVRGNLPSTYSNQQMLVDSGFFEHVSYRVRLPKVIDRGVITQRQSKKVESETAAELIHHGTRILFGQQQSSKASYRVLIEAMGNTHNHAAGSRYARRETWWGTVYVDRQRNRICFSFVDTGVGIFRSLKVRSLKRVYNLLMGRTDADILRDMLEGRVESSTGLSYRGRGLPSINTLWKRGDLKKLVIVSNDVYADVGEDRFFVLRRPFHGTLLYWEV